MGSRNARPGQVHSNEVEELLERLQNPDPDTETTNEVPIWRRSVQDDVLGQISAERLAIELRRRGWSVVEP